MVGRAVLVLNDDVGGVRFTEGVCEDSTVQYKTFLEQVARDEKAEEHSDTMRAVVTGYP